LILQVDMKLKILHKLQNFRSFKTVLGVLFQFLPSFDTVYIILYYVTLHCIIICYITLHYIILYYMQK